MLYPVKPESPAAPLTLVESIEDNWFTEAIDNLEKDEPAFPEEE